MNVTTAVLGRSHGLDCEVIKENFSATLPSPENYSCGNRLFKRELEEEFEKAFNDPLFSELSILVLCPKYRLPEQISYRQLIGCVHNASKKRTNLDAMICDLKAKLA